MASKPAVTSDIQDKKIAWVSIRARKVNGNIEEANALTQLWARIAKERGFDIYYVSSTENKNDDTRH